MAEQRRIRVLVAKPGLDGHDRGARIIARVFRDAGFEVIYTGCHQTPEQIVSTALQEDVDLIGLSILSGAHMYSFPRVMELLKENNADDITVIGGGIFPLNDIPKLKESGIKEVFEPGAKLEEIVSWVNSNVSARDAVHM
jgi:methylmalonyl-CoA mutase C-terminal domain/subunit